MKTTDIPFVVTEWDWFQLKLELYAQRMHSPAYRVDFDFVTEKRAKERRLVCTIVCKTTQMLVKRAAGKRTQLKHYREWIKKEKRNLARVLADIPILGQDLDLEQDVTFVIAYNYGTGAASVCECVGKDFIWK